jgi:hypothetical protein
MSFSSSFPSNSYESDEEKDVPATLNPNASEPARPASRATSASTALHQGRVTQINAEHERVNEEQRILDEEERLLELQEAQAALHARRLALQQRRHRLGQQTSSLPPAVDINSYSTAPAAAVSTPVRPVMSSASRRLQMTAVSQAAYAATLARQQSIDSLPDAVPAIFSPATGRASTTATATEAVVQKVKTPMPKEFTSLDEQQNRGVKAWITQLDNYLSAYNLSPADYYNKATAFLTGKAIDWLANKQAEVESVGKLMTWDWLCTQLIEDFAQASGETALHSEWLVLRMGTHGDLGRVGTRTVRDYTDRFLEYMRALTHHQITTTEMTVIDRYLAGIQLGYPALWTAMLVNGQEVRYYSLLEARHAAATAESKIKAAGIRAGARTAAGVRQAQVNNAYAVLGEDGGDLPDGDGYLPGESSSQSSASVNNVQSPSGGKQFIDGRYVLTAPEKQLLMKERRCYRCYEQHAFGRHVPRCSKPVQKTAPRPLNP